MNQSMIEVPEITKAYLCEHHPALVESLRAEAYEKGLMEGKEKERERIKAVEEQLIPGHERLIAALKFDGQTTGAEAAIQVLAAEKQQRATALQSLRADAPAPLPQPSIAVGQEKAQEDADDALPLEEKCQAKWQKSPDIRAEFGNLETYIAFSKAWENGQVKMLRNHKEGGAKV